MSLSELKASFFGQGWKRLASPPAERFVTDRTIPGKERPPLTPVVQLSPSDKADFGRRPLHGTHNLHQSELFTDAALIDLLDHFPRQHLYALTTGNDLARTDDNRLALHDGVSGAELLRAVRNGRLWLNITRVDRADARYRALIDQLYAQLATQAPGFSPVASQGTLLVSSPHALVYYHANGRVWKMAPSTCAGARWTRTSDHSRRSYALAWPSAAILSGSSTSRACSMHSSRCGYRYRCSCSMEYPSPGSSAVRS